jgi:uncharacterized protein with PIN domain
MKLFDNRCPNCRGMATEVHELEPRSRGKYTMRMQNRTAICRTCHDEFHKYGSSEHSVNIWKEIIHDYLRNIGAWDIYMNWGNNG